MTTLQLQMTRGAIVQAFQQGLLDGDLDDKAEFIATLLGNVFGPIEDWERFMDHARRGCGKPGCKCHMRVLALLEGISAIRADYARVKAKAADERPLGRQAAPGFVHVAGEYRDGVQCCIHCAGTLCDDRGAQYAVEVRADGSTDPLPKGFPVGSHVELLGKPGAVCAGVVEAPFSSPLCNE